MIHFIINPSSQSGKGLSIWHELKSRIDRLPIAYDTYFTRTAADTSAYVAALTGITTELCQLAVIGGDGTLNEVVNAVSCRHNTCITYFPSGSGNDFARSTGIRCGLDNCITRLTSMQDARPYDIGAADCYESDGSITTRYFVISSGIGFDAASCKASLDGAVKNILNRIGMGKLTYLVNAIRCLFSTPESSCRITIDDCLRLRVDDLLFCVSMVQKYEGGGFPFCPLASNNDGRLDICLVNGMKKRHVSYLMPLALFGYHVKSRFVRRFRGKSIDIHTSQPLYVHTDGEVPGMYTHVRMYIPEDGVMLFR